MKSTRYIAIFLSVLLFTVILPFSSVQANTEESLKEQERIEQIEKFYEIYAYLQEYHVDNPSAERLMEDAILGMFFFMDDPYTTYMDEEDYQQFINSVNGAFVGIGIYAELVEEGVLIQDIIPGGSAEKARLQIGDIITSIDGELIIGDSVEEATASILGEEGTEVEITIERLVDGEPQTFTYTLIREEIQLPHVELVMLDRDTAHLKLYRFGADTYDIIKRELQRMEEMGVERVILDLRGNSGGMMDSVIDIASLFKESGTIFHTKDNAGTLESYDISKGNEWDKPLVVLIDFSSASAAEVLAGFLQDYELATLIGEDSFGKGRIQTSIELDHGGVLHISIEEYFTPNMNKVDHEGIQPDIYVLDPDLQLAKAYGLLKDRDDIELYMDGRIAFNGLKEEKFKKYAFHQDEIWYLSMRMLSDWFGGIIEWDWETQGVSLQLFENTYLIERNHPQLQLVDDKAYLSLDFVVEEMPLELVEEDQKLVLKRKE